RNRVQNVQHELSKVSALLQSEEEAKRLVEEQLAFFNARVTFSERKIELTKQNEELQEECFIVEQA
ncbi:unnamed protein product, partial [Amoebophrya sp. A25]